MSNNINENECKHEKLNKEFEEDNYPEGWLIYWKCSNCGKLIIEELPQ